MLDNKFVSLDNIYHRQISKGCIICIYGDYYPSSYWYVYEKDKTNMLTIIKLDNYYKPHQNPSKILKLKAKDVDYMIISNPKNKINPFKIEVDIPATFFKNYHENRLNIKQPKYGDILLIEKNFFSYGAFFVLNYEPHNYTYLIYNISSGKTENIYIELCKYETITNKELRREIYTMSENIRFKHINTNYKLINDIDDKIFFQTKMNYLFDSGINNACLGLIELGFLNEPLTSLSGKINEQLNLIEEKNNEVLELILNYNEEDSQCDNNDENFINSYLTDYKYTTLNQFIDEFSDSDDDKSSSEGDTIDYPECSYDKKYNHYIEDESYDSYNEEEKYNNMHTDEYTYEKKYNNEQQHYEDHSCTQEQQYNTNTNQYYEDHSCTQEQQYNTNTNQYYEDDSYEQDDSFAEEQQYYEDNNENQYYEDDSCTEEQQYYEDNNENQYYEDNSCAEEQQYYEDNSCDEEQQYYEDQKYIENIYEIEEQNKEEQIINNLDKIKEYENTLESKVDELYNYINTIEQNKEEVNNDEEMPPLIQIEYYEINNVINNIINDVVIQPNNNDKEIEQLTLLLNNCKLDDTNEINKVKEEEKTIIDENISNEDYVTITHDEIEPISRESCSIM
jgi:hypothetical protein